MSLFNELKRRKVFRVAIGYVVAAWLIAQVADLLADTYLAPAWVMQMIVTLLIVGLPISLTLSWAFDLTGEGIRRTESGGVEGSLTVSNKSLLGVVCGLFIAVTASFYVFWPRDDRSVAVLPFEDISPGGDQAYFGNGLADELRLELQRLDGLRVAGQTSSIASAQEDYKTIGETLNVESILEGSIRKEADNVRITVQLNDVANGFTIWSDSYSGELADIFELQKEIATSVAGEMGVRLGVGTLNAFQGAGTRNVEAYEAFLQARTLSSTPRSERIRLLKRAIELDPNYAAAWASLGGQTFMGSSEATPDQQSEVVEEAYKLALHAAQLNPELAMAQSLLASIRHARHDWIGSEQAYGRTLELLTDRDILIYYGYMVMRTGRTAYAQTQFARAVALESLGGRPPYLAYHASLAEGRIDEAKERITWWSARSQINNNLNIAFNESDPEALKAAIQALPETNVATIMLYAPVLAEFDSPERILSILREVYLDENLHWERKLLDIAMLAAYFDDPKFALKMYRAGVLRIRIETLWYPVMSEARQLPEFKELVTELNLVEYWRAYEWADFCAPLGDDDFTCR